MNNLSAAKSRNPAAQLLRYALVGIASNLAGYITYLLITFLGAAPKTTMSLLYGVGAAVGFWGNRTVTFAHTGSLIGVGTRYFIAHCCGYVINLAILIVMVDRLGYPHQLVQAIAILVVAAFVFLALKYFVFSKTESYVK